ncbi:hypothetical protein D9619_002447 [Psilocybe cf. subviscida]|uniref:Uncharacterized protein n=1 Tax=Psilocybe cf. subviscida TaxID=2480587 RepID=A0A8H5ETQ9_9AGAR|nr:hypothetical protein D9619_002447 [Psilocybe cf. subviscida]
MRRAQSVRNHMARPSLALAADDLGVLREGDESNEDVLRRQLVDKDRECDRVRLSLRSRCDMELNMTVAALQQQLKLRPPEEEIKKLREEQQSLDVLMLGYQRENEKSMAIIEQYKNREKMLERELNRLAGDNWRSALEIPPSAMPRSGTLSHHHRSNTISISSPYSSHSHSHSYSQSQSYSPGSSSWLGDTTLTGNAMGRSRSPSPTMRPHQRRQQQQQQHSRQNSTQDDGDDDNNNDDASPQQAQQRALQGREEREARDAAQRAALLAQIEQMRVFILGMEKRLDVREEKLGKTLEKAESESRRYEEAAVAASLKAA